MGLAGRSCWSWAGLAVWVSNAALVAALAVGLVFGVEVADRAWDGGVHVTPEQAAMHGALMAQGLAHHHGHAALPAGQTSESPSLQAGSSGMSWGQPFTPASQPELPACPALAGCVAVPLAGAAPVSADLVAPPVPPG